MHIDLKTASLQGEAYDQTPSVACQLPPGIGYPSHIGAKLKKAAFCMNDAPRRWWDILDKALESYGMILIRADRCCCVSYDQKREEEKSRERLNKIDLGTPDSCGQAVEYIMDPMTGS